MTKVFFLCTVLTGLFGYALTAHANEPEAAADTTVNQSANVSADKKEPVKEDKSTAAKSSSPEFNPTEEISEDLSVPFPVDI